MMQEKELLPHLFRTEYRNIISVLCSVFGIQHIELAEDIVSDTFLLATELWSNDGIPESPTGWLYTVAKNKTLNHLKRNAVFSKKIAAELEHDSHHVREIEIDLSVKNIEDSQLAMIFTICNPCISVDSQISLALSLLCGFGTQEIADAFLTNKEVIYKRLNRAKEKLKEEKIKIEQPGLEEIDERLDTVLTTLYLMFSEGYYSTSQNTILRKDVCAEAMRLNHLLIENQNTQKPPVNALYALMCFHSSRFEARINPNGDVILYDDQDTTLWDKDLINKGINYLNKAASGSHLSKYHLEAGIAYWHTIKEDSAEKWESILELYNHLLILQYSPIAALNRTYALAKTKGKEAAIREAEKLKLESDHFYHVLLGNLYTSINNEKALRHFKCALEHAKSASDKAIIIKNIERLK